MNETNETGRYSSYESVPLFLDAADIMNVLGLSRTTVYSMLQEPDFPTIELGKRRIVRKEKLFEWINAHENPDSCINDDQTIDRGSRFCFIRGGDY